jgi:hypothetical protein
MYVCIYRNISDISALVHACQRALSGGSFSFRHPSNWSIVGSRSVMCNWNGHSDLALSEMRYLVELVTKQQATTTTTREEEQIINICRYCLSLTKEPQYLSSCERLFISW